MTSDVDPTILKEWLNRRLAAVGGYVGDLYEDLRDGRNLILLLGVLFDQQICRELGRLRIHMLRNARVVLNFLGIDEADHASGIRAEDIVNGNQNETRFLVTMIFRKFQMSEWKNGSPLCKRNEVELLVNMEPEAVFDHGSNTFDEFLPSFAVGGLIEPEYVHYLDKEDKCAETSTRKFIQRQRLELIPQPILPYEKSDGDVVPNWNFTAWSQPIIDVHVGDAKRMLIDAFVIYLARVVGNTTLHIGWETKEISAAWKDATVNYHLVPMTVTVPLNEPWGSVSEVVNEELANLARNSGIPLDQVGSSDSESSLPSVERINPWRIVVSMSVGRDLENENRPSRGTVLTLQIRENGEFRWIYNSSYLDADVIARITEHLKVLTSEYLVASSNESPVCQLNMLSTEEKNFLLTNFFPKERIASKNVCLHDIFERRVIREPKATALIHGDEKWTYEDLNARANRLAHQLIDSGVVTECLVGICVSVSPAMLVGVLAILKAGGAYVPLDPVYPRRHLVEIITDTSVKTIIADKNGSLKLGKDILATMTIIDPNSPMLRSVANPVVDHLTSKNLACVICTSGTSGKPKQVMVEHRNITTFCDASESSYQFDELDVWILFHSISFYVSLFEVWGAFSHGGQLVLFSSDAVRSAEETYQHICEHSVTVLYQMPSAFERLVAVFIEKSVPKHLRYVAFTGESFDPRILRPLFVSQGHALPHFVNIFGASEIPFRVSSKIFDEQDTLRSCSTIGECYPGVRVYLLDSHGFLMPFGAVGELYVGGECVARGYLNKPDLTRERFLADPYSDYTDAKMYKTGDLARCSSNGNLVSVNRVDQQIELRGYSIKPGDIVTCLRSHPIVKDAFVCAVGNEVDKILISYVVAEPVDNLPDILQRYLTLRLPAHMVPVQFVRIDQFPLTLNGKLDIGALSPIDSEKLTADMFPLIDLTQTDIDRIVSQVEGGMDNIQDIYALSPLQDTMMYGHLADTDADPYQLMNLKIFSDFAILQRYISAMSKVIHRHDALRTAFFWKDLTTPAQVVHRRIILPVTEKTLDPDMQLNCLKHCDNPYQSKFDLQQAPLLRLVISRTSTGEWLLREVIHHMIIDNITMDIINTEINAICNEREESLSRPTPFRNFIAHVRSNIRPEVHEEFFTSMLADIDEPTMCFDLAAKHTDASSIVFSECMLSYEMYNLLRSHSEYSHTTLETLCHLAWGLVVSKVSRRAKLVFGTVLSGRVSSCSEVETQVGLYINTLPIKLIIDGTPLNDCVRQTHHRMGELIEHKNASLVIAQWCSRIPNDSPLFNSLFEYRHYVRRTKTADMMLGMRVIRARAQTHYPLTVCVDDTSTELTMSSRTVESVDSERVCGYMRRALESIAENLTEEPEISINSIQILPDGERRVLLEMWNNVDMSPPDSVCIHQLFEKQAILTPTKTALIRKNKRITYAELNTRANRLAHHLIELGVRPECLIGLCVSPSFAMIVGLLAIHKAGAAYVPLDSSYPELRLVQMIGDTRLRIIIADEQGADQLKNQMADTLIFINPNDRFDQAPSNPIVRDLSQSNLAYVIYTSGSTGQPKGVMVEHRNIVRLFETTEPLFCFTENDIWCLVHSISFDFSVWEMWGALRYGGQLVILTLGEVRSVYETYNLLREHHVSVLCQTPSQFKMLNERLLAEPVRDHLRKIIFGGEALDATCLRSFYDRRTDSMLQLYNMYGPTEVTVHATFQVLHEANTLKTTSLIGKHLPDTQLYVLDGNRHSAPFGMIGNLYVGGQRLARGYWNRPELTIERFLIDPFSDSVDALIYKTGDFARFLPDGSLEYIGRDDQQVKIGKYRIELGEIEACLRSHGAVRDARVVMFGNDPHKRLVAYVVVDQQDDLEAMLLLYAKKWLPEFMIPCAIIRIDAFPLTPNGKLDLQALPLYNISTSVQNSSEVSRGEVENKIASVCKELLNVEHVSREDSFFALGGNSLLAVGMIQRVRSHGYQLDINAAYAQSTLAELAMTAVEHPKFTIPDNIIPEDVTKLTPDMLTLIDLTQTDIDRIVSQVSGGVNNVQDIYALSPLQDGMLFYHVLHPDTDPYLLTTEKIFTDVRLLNEYISALQIVVDRHDALRTAFFWDGLTKPAQVVLRTATLSVTEKTRELDVRSDINHPGISEDTCYRSINLQRAPLLHLLIVRESDGSWVLFEEFHHIIVDQTTIEIIYAEIHEILSKRKITVHNPTPFRNFIAHIQSSIRPDVYEAFFTELLTDIDEPTLCFGLADVHRDGSLITESYRTLSQRISTLLRRQAGNLNVSPATLCHLATGLFVSKTSGRRKVVFGTVLLGRMSSGDMSDGQVGLYINTLPMKITIDDTELTDCVIETHEKLGSLLKHENASLIMAQRCSGIPKGSPLFNCLLNYRHTILSPKIDDTVSGMHICRTQGRTNYPLMLCVDDDNESLVILSQTVTSVDSERVCAYMQQAVESVIESLDITPNISVTLLKVLPECEREMLLNTWNTVNLSTPELSLVHQLFEKQVILRPTQTALMFKYEIMIYADVNERANSLADHLIELGVGPDCLVGLCVSPSFAMIVGLLAILKAGGAYVPLDPAYPKQRIFEIIADAALGIILADDIGLDRMGDNRFETIVVIDPNQQRIRRASNRIIPQLSEKNLAYVIYTSGSTGQPKGVMVEHRHIVRFFESTYPIFNYNHTDVSCLFHSISFDVSVWEIFGALNYGGRLVLISRDDVHEPDVVFRLVCHYHVTILNQTPTAFKAYIGKFLSKPVEDHLRCVVLAGESLDPSILQPLYIGRMDSLPRFFNAYGPAEGTVTVTVKELTSQDVSASASIIGKHFADIRMYLLDDDGQPIPLGAIGELYIGGAGVARGYLNRSYLDIERFLSDSFSDSIDSRMYKTGDLARYTLDGQLIFLGRNDQQVKIRGYRVETGEIESILRQHPLVSDVYVCTDGEMSPRRLIAYVIALDSDELASKLHLFLTKQLPEYMIPSVFVRMDKFPITCNGKIDTKALPSPDESSFVRCSFEAPQNEIEICLARVWQKNLGVENIGRHDSYFALGGNSLIALQLIESLIFHGLTITLSDLFRFPILSDLAKTVRNYTPLVIPINLITPGCQNLTPDMLPLVDLTQSDINHIVSSVPGGLPNIQDVYGLSPLQEGMLYHHLLSEESDPYLTTIKTAFKTYDLLDRYVDAYRQVIDRHDILRTSIFWEELSVPVQVVHRRVHLSVTEVISGTEDDLMTDESTRADTQKQGKINLNEAPLLRMVISRERGDRWILVCTIHHLIYDGDTQTFLNAEVQAFMNGNEMNLDLPYPFRNHIANMRNSMNQADHIEFFTQMLADLDEPIYVYGFAQLHVDSTQMNSSELKISSTLADRILNLCRSLDVSSAALYHLAWSLVVSKTSAKNKAIFGTVLLGRSGADENSKIGVGMYVNTLPFRMNVDTTPVHTCLRDAQIELSRLLKHQSASLASVQRYSGIAGNLPLFDSLLNVRDNSSMVSSSQGTVDFEVLQVNSRTNYPLTVIIGNSSSELILQVQLTRPFDSSSVCCYMQAAFSRLSDALGTTMQTPLSSIQILPETERSLLINELNDNIEWNYDPTCIHHLFERRVSLTPYARALVYEDQQMTYTELNACANRLAHSLIKLGVAPDCLVGLCVSVSPAMLVGLLAILKAGGAYVPLDPTYPSQRLVDIMADARLHIIVADEIGSHKLKDFALQGKILVDPNADVVQPDTNPFPHELDCRNLAYVIYTSGSTGRPKGVMVEHCNVTSLFDATDIVFHFSEHDIWSLTHSIAFDFSVWQIWGALRHGGQLVLIPRETVRSSDALYDQICQHRVSVFNQTASQFRIIIDKFTALPIQDHVKYVIFGGESLEPQILKGLYETRGDFMPLLCNMYGTSETTVHSTFKALHKVDSLRSTCSIGKRLLNTRTYVLDENRRPVPFGVIGELYISGRGVARGYLNRSELTRERFFDDLYSDCISTKMYRTGDLVRVLPDNGLEFIGRDDHQVKIRGYRIELSEIEACLRCHEAVRDARVLVIGDDIYKRLVAYIVASRQTDLEDALRSYVKSQLPEFMVPVAIMIIDEIPLTHNGKVDLDTLPSFERHDLSQNTYEAPRGEVELTIAAIWRELFDVEDVSRHDSFFALGGHSLLAIRMIERMRRHGFRITINDLYVNSTLSELAITTKDDAPLTVPRNLIERGISKLTPEMLPLIDLIQTDIDCIVSQAQGGIENIQDIYALSPLQDGMMFHHLLDTETDPYLLMNQKIFSDSAILERYISAMRRVIHRHDVLRTAFFWKNLSTPAQVVFREVVLPLTEETLDPDMQLDFQKYGDNPYQPPFDLQRAPLLRLVISRTINDEWLLREVIHHIIIDNVTMDIMNAEIDAIYNEREESLPRPTPYRNFIAHIRSSIRPKVHEEFFTSMLDDIDEPTLCFDLASKHANVSFIVVSQCMLSYEMDDQLRRQAGYFNTTLATLCHLAWGLVASKLSRKAKLVFGTVLFGRMASSSVVDTQVGLYINTLPIKLMIDGTPLSDCVRETHHRMGQLLEHENASLVIAQRCSRIPNGTPLFNSLLNYRHYVRRTRTDDMMMGIRTTCARTQTHYPLTVCVDDTATELTISLQTAESVDSDRVCAYMQRALELIAESLTREPEITIKSLQILPDRERQVLLETWNNVDMSAPDSVCIHQLFEKQASLTPTKTALIQEDEGITYAELNTRANRLAHHLIELGVRPECLIGLSVAPSFAMIVGLLAIHKAGGAYIPLDSSYPKQRLVQMVEDTEIQIIVADERGTYQLTDLMADTLIFINPNDRFDQASSDPIVRNLSQANLAYVIYTSGSTGQPKGVMVEHCNIVRLFETTEPLYSFSENDIWCLVHSISFDFSVWEVWGALRYGGLLVIMSHKEVRSNDDTFDLVCKHNVSVLCQTTSQFMTFHERLLAQPVRDNLRTIIFGGESLDATSLRSFYDRRADPVPQLYNMYGPTEVTVYATFQMLREADTLKTASLIGKHLPDTHTYVLDKNRHPAPIGVVGDLYVGSLRLARGYWNRPDLTIERFVPDSFSDSVRAFMYKTGDLARFLPDGTLEFIGRDDQQVKLRGYRIDLGEVEACFRSHEAVRDARVLMIGDDIYKRLVAYVVGNLQTDSEETLRSYAKSRLPEFMVPVAIMIIDEIPLNHNGKIDLQALPLFERHDLSRNTYEAPRGKVELVLADIWKELFDVRDVSRHDSFFALGGHSLLAIRMIERMRHQDYRITINDLYVNSTLSELAITALHDVPLTVPENLIKQGISELTPEMLPLIDLTQTDIDFIVSRVPGGIDNIQDIYALSPLQDGILFHHVLNTETDPYLLRIHKTISDISILERYISAMQIVIDRHDVLRTAFFWENLFSPAQVVFRKASLSVTEKTLDSGLELDMSTYNSLFQSETLDLHDAPLLRFKTARRSDKSCDLGELLHHIIADHGTLEFMHAEIHALLVKQEVTLPNSIPFRNFIAHIRSNIRSEAHQNFFEEMLTDIDEPTLCFGLSVAQSDSPSVGESHRTLSCETNVQLRRQATHFEVTPATLCHVAWGLVVSSTSKREKPVFGTVLFGRMNVSNVTGHQMGLYINTLPIKLLMDDTPLIECVRQSHETLGLLLKHENAPLVMAQRCSRVSQGTPLFNSILNYRHNVTPARINHTVPGIHSIRAHERTNYSLTCSVDDDSVSIKISSLTAEPVDSDRVCAYMQRALESIVESLIRTPGKSMISIQILPDSERQILLETWNTVNMSAPDSVCIHQLFEKQVILTPTKTALTQDNGRLTYAELNTRANRLAHHLIELGVGPECPVGLCVSPSFAMIVGLLAIHKAGGAYVPLDPSYPEQRLVQMVRDIELRIIVADEKGADQLEDRMADTLIFINPNDRFDQASSNPIVRDLSQANLAYVIYTSGSTGQPKGVMVEHRNIVRLFETTEPLFCFSENDVWCLVHSISFDFSVWELWGALRYGGLLVIISREEVRSIDETHDILCKHHVSILCQTPSQFKMLKERLVAEPVRDHLRKIIFGGESLDATCFRSFYNRRADLVTQMYNMYGPTEATVHATIKVLHEGDTLESSSLIGKHLPDTQLYVLDKNRQPAPVGVVGNLYVGGRRLARGYWNRPELTTSRFIMDPFSDSVDAHIYKTGDLARFLSDGSLEYIGRDDQQVKLRGYRIELGEVEACLRIHEAVRDARVLIIGDDIHKRLVAYVVANRENDLKPTLCSYARSQLPEFMVPVAIMIIDEIPLNHNGKIDLQALPSFERNDFSQNTYEMPRGEVELTLAAIWEELLDVEDVGRHDSFFALGGHSLLAIRMIERMRRQGYRIGINDLYVNSTLSELAITALDDAPLTVPENFIERGMSQLTPEMLPLIDLTQNDIDYIVSQVPGGVDNIQDIYALSSLQDGILFHHMLNTETDPYLVRIHRTVSNISILERYISAMRMVIDRHDVLRTAFFWENLSSPAQVVFRKASLSVTEKTLDSGLELDMSTYNSLFQSETLDLHDAPLLRFKTARRSDNSWDLGELLHHIIADHETFEFMNAEIHALLVQQGTTLPNSIPFRNFIAYVRSTIRSEAHQNFFEEMLTDIDEPTLCFGFPVRQSDGLFIGQSRRTLSCETNVQLRRQATHFNVSPATLCHVAWGLVVSSTSKQEKPVFGTVLFGRMNFSNVTGHQMGLYINTLPIKLLIDDTPLIECVRQTHERLGHLLTHENASLVMAQRCSRVSHGTPLFDSILNYRHNVTPTTFNNKVLGIHLIQAHERTNYSLTCSVDDDSVSMKISLQTAEPCDSDRVCAYMQQALESIVGRLTQEPDKMINSIEILPDNERQLLLETWNSVDVSAPDCVCMHQLFEKQVILTPMKTALIQGHERITYAELNTRANRLAHHLIELEVKPECLVGLCVSPSFAMIVGLLAIHKAGGAYVPLDSSYPAQRLLQIIEDTRLRIIITDEKGAYQLKDLMADTSILINPNDRFDQATSDPIVRGLSQANLAYVIYTSGSTGQPKGVMVEHRNIVRLFETTELLFRLNQNDVWCLVHSIAFDFSVWEVWGALRYGGQLVLMSREEVRSIDETYDLVCEHQVSVLCQTTSQFMMLYERLLTKPIRDHLRTIMFGGESLDATCLRSFYNRRTDSVPQLYSMYGPTEVTVYATFMMLHESDTLKSSSLIGKHLPDTQIYVLDGTCHLVPQGVVGDLYVGSQRLSRGYWNRAELTIERFIADPFSDAIDSYIYRTGDLARFLPDGTLEYIGRDDQQVKIRGYRIELGEVEACLRTHEAVRDARVLMIGDDICKRLVAYVVANRATNFEQTLRSYMNRQLPEFMVPFAIIIIDEIPLTLNGKLDRKALPIPNSASVARTSYEPPSTHTEWKLATIWSQLLGIDQISRNDNFFHVGGHSLLAVRMIALVAEQGLACTLNDLFQYPLLRDLASKIEVDSEIEEIYSAIPIRPTGMEPPIFFVPTGFGDYSYVFGLSPYIQTSCPIYALPWPPSQVQPLSTMKEMARKMIPLIKAVQPQGPYRICGYSTGGILCHAIAYQLHESGNPVAFVGLIDTTLHATRGTNRTQRRQLSAILDLLATIGLERIDDIVGLCKKFAEMSFVELIEAGKQLKLYASNLRSEIHAQKLEQRVNFMEMVMSYVPEDLGIVIHQFNASELSKVEEYLSDQIEYLGKRCQSDLVHALTNISSHIVPIPGDHVTMMENSENRSILGTAINKAIHPHS